MIRPADPDGMRAAWDALGTAWAGAIARAHDLPETAVYTSVGGEWSFVDTLRHLVFAMDKWFTVPVAGGDFHPIGRPNSGSADVPFPGLDPSLTPSLAEALAVRAERSARLHEYLASLDADDLDRPVEVMENGVNPVRECLYTVFEEEFWHLRYADRDLAVLEAAR
jgi:hypothetical protein